MDKQSTSMPAETSKIKKNWWDYIPAGNKLKEYCDVTTLHGFRYLGEPGRSLSERIFWLVSLLFVNMLVAFAIYDQIWLFLRIPILMSFESTSTPVRNIPFPALTICSENQIRPSSFNLRENLNKANLSEMENATLQYASLICALDLKEKSTEFIRPDYVNSILNDGFSTCNTTFSGIKWLNKLLDNPCQYLEPTVVVNQGVCHTFNSVPSDLLLTQQRSKFHNQTMRLLSLEEGIVWTPDSGYKGSKQYENMPWRTSKTSFGNDVFMLLNLNRNDIDDICFFGGRGFVIYIHSPADLPTPSDPSIYAKVDEYTHVKITPQLKTIQKELRSWKPEDRGCFFEQEKQLKFFQFYTERNCDLECEANLSISLCGCAAFSQPRLNTTLVCGTKKYRCIEDSFIAFNDRQQDMYSACKCLPSCSEFSYEVSATSVKRNFSYFSTKHTYSSNVGGTLTNQNFAAVTMDLQARKIIAMKRVATFGLSDFVANIGGLLGLFLGFSFISLLEIIYFLCLRFRKRKPNQIRTLASRTTFKN